MQLHQQERGAGDVSTLQRMYEHEMTWPGKVHRELMPEACAEVGWLGGAAAPSAWGIWAASAVQKAQGR